VKRVLVLAMLASGCGDGVKLDSFLYSPLAPPPGGYQLSTAIIPNAQTVTINTIDGERLDARFIPSSGAHRDITIVYFHGQSTNLGTAWPRIELLHPIGCNLLVFDYRGYGFSTGTPSEDGFHRDEDAVYATALALADARLVYYGRSLGGAPAIELASRLPPSVLVTESAFASVAELVSDGAYADFPAGFVATSVWDSRDKIARVPSPYLALHGAADDYVQPKYAVELTDAHPGETQLVLVAGADHSNVPDKMGVDAYRLALERFIGADAP
jgi:fermentation-respiration switch protein FrsA (DUF1100 family)